MLLFLGGGGLGVFCVFFKCASIMFQHNVFMYHYGCIWWYWVNRARYSSVLLVHLLCQIEYLRCQVPSQEGLYEWDMLPIKI